MSGLREERRLGAVMALNIAIIWEGEIAGQARSHRHPPVGADMPRDKVGQDGSVARIDSR